MVEMRRREPGLVISGVVPSLVLSLLASAAASYLLRRLLSTETQAGGPQQESGQRRAPSGNVGVVVPVIVLTIVSGNRWSIGPRGMPPPFFLPFLIARVIRKRRQKRAGWQRRKG